MNPAGTQPVTADALVALIASAGDLIGIASADGVLRSLNPAGLALLGIPDLDVAQDRTLPGLLVNGARQRVGGILAAVAASGERWRGELSLQRQDGALVPMCCEMFAFQGGPGEARQVAVIGRTRTARAVDAEGRGEDADASRRLRDLKNALRADVSGALITIAEQQEALQACCAALVRHLGVAFARIWILDEGQQVLVLEASAGLYTHRDGAHGRVPVGKYKIGQIAAQRAAHLTNAVIGDPRVPEQEWARRQGLVTFAGYPLIAGDRLVGVMAMFSRTPMDEETFDALALIAEVIAHGLRRRSAEQRLIDQAAELQRINGELEQFTYVASHDLQEPLRTMANYLGILQRRYGDALDEKARRYLTHAVDGALRMQALIRDLLDFSRCDPEAAASESLGADEAVRKALQNLDGAIAEAQATITVDALPTVSYPRLHLTQIFQNLVGNALKYRGAYPPRVRISAHRYVDGWVFSVADNGIGIDPAHHQRIFEVFQRLHKRGEYAGTGIGLALCRKLVTLHRGRIWVESTAGCGSTFSFTVPATAPPGACI